MPASAALEFVTARFTELGLRLTVSQDFSEFKRANDRIPERLGLAPIFAPDLEDPQVGSGLWYGVEDASGRVVLIYGYRMVDLQGAGIARHLSERKDLYFSRAMGLDPARSSIHVGASAWEVDGHCCYHGELWLAPRLRRLGLARNLLLVGQAHAAVTFRPDFFFGLTVPATSNLHFIRGIGYRHFQPSCSLARDETGRLVRKEGLVWTSLAEVLSRDTQLTPRAAFADRGLLPLPGHGRKDRFPTAEEARR